VCFFHTQYLVTNDEKPIIAVLQTTIAAIIKILIDMYLSDPLPTSLAIYFD